MDTAKNGKVSEPKGEDLNGDGPAFKEPNKRKRNGASAIKDHITTADGRVFYPCRFCNKVFPIRKSRTAHTKKCPAKEYILSVGEGQESPAKESPVKQQPNIPADKPAAKKINIKQNIVLTESPPQKSPIKLTIRRSPSNGSSDANHFTVSNNSVVLKEKNESNDEFTTIAKRLESNSVTLIKQPKQDAAKADEKTDESLETACRECGKEFESPLELLRHSRKCHSYPKVVMAMSEVKKFYTMKDRSECPICHKPLKTNFRSAFVKHLHTHTNETKYSCHVCNKKFRRSDHMKAHEKRHIVQNEK